MRKSNSRQATAIENRGELQKFYLRERDDLADVHPSLSEQSQALARLLQQPIYREDGSLWGSVRGQGDAIANYFRQIGQNVVADEAEGVFLRQIERKAATPSRASVVPNLSIT